MTTDLPDTDLHDLVQQWADAEAAANTVALDALLADDFVGIGPVGFALDRPQWLRRFDDGLTFASLTITDVSVRHHGDVAVAVGVQTQSATYRSRPMEGRFRISLVLHRRDGLWVVLNVHLSGPMPPEGVRR